MFTAVLVASSRHCHGYYELCASLTLLHHAAVFCRCDCGMLLWFVLCRVESAPLPHLDTTTRHEVNHALSFFLGAHSVNTCPGRAACR